jgi:hypothetical protein
VTNPPQPGVNAQVILTLILLERPRLVRPGTKETEEGDEEAFRYFRKDACIYGISGGVTRIVMWDCIRGGSGR